MNRLVLIALAFSLVFNFAASQSVMIETCAATDCGSSCLNCDSATDITNTDSTNDLVVCPQSGTFCFIDTLFDNGTSCIQNCTSCTDNTSASCTGCVVVTDSFSQDFCTTDGSCWSIFYNNTETMTVSVGQTGTNISMSDNSTSVDGSNTTTATVSSSDCNCTDATTGMTGTTGVDSNGDSCSCPAMVANITSNPNGNIQASVSSSKFNESLSVTSFGTSLQSLFSIFVAMVASAVLV